MELAVEHVFVADESEKIFFGEHVGLGRGGGGGKRFALGFVDVEFEPSGPEVGEEDAVVERFLDGLQHLIFVLVVAGIDFEAVGETQDDEGEFFAGFFVFFVGRIVQCVPGLAHVGEAGVVLVELLLEAIGLGLGGVGVVGVGVEGAGEGGGFVALGATGAPEGGGKFFDESAFDVGGGGEVGVEAMQDGVEVGGFVGRSRVGEKDAAGVEAMAEAVGGGAGFAFGCAGAGRFLGVLLVGVDLSGGHGFGHETRSFLGLLPVLHNMGGTRRMLRETSKIVRD